MSAAALVSLMRAPDRAPALRADQWNGLISAARAERLLGTLAVLLEDIAVPDTVRAILSEARLDAEREQRIALWEANRAAEALAPLGLASILLKGAAYAAASLRASDGRMVGDLDILVPRDRLEEAEAALRDAGWEWVKPDPYDDAYYRQWMHELPPLIHRERDRMIDVHHTILPLTARPRPDASALIAQSVDVGGGLRVLSPEDRVVHAVAHMLADGDLSGGLRNLWDIRCLIAEVEDKDKLDRRAAHHGLTKHLARVWRLVDHVYGQGKTGLHLTDRLFLRRLLTRDGWGRDSRKGLGLAFYIRSHLLRMPPLMLIRHLFTKWRKGHRPV
ncbi:MAG: nucleotidyltransferase family protein [Sphingobium sp.]|nr:nucleotidyltransferase family protein [Sphingobium sp.]MBP6111045.1 nucleotidyltransferase family protein [Sphingobium sp.]MBP8670187.1 nucleotidyltransferase family protein [Sphingobium sp.]MBP9157221.1 nucleotidyltransferase family protein [Sphingobium sp.]MCC6481047.1 nucleotidyltransferase family protein [Sphingomonadaceae bacterium]